MFMHNLLDHLLDILLFASIIGLIMMVTQYQGAKVDKELIQFERVLTEKETIERILKDAK